MGKCPDCGQKIGPIAIVVSWDNWGKFVCPGCGTEIQFKNWLVAVAALMGLFIGAERILHFMLISRAPLWLSFTISFLLALFIMFMIPMIWNFKNSAT